MQQPTYLLFSFPSSLVKPIGDSEILRVMEYDEMKISQLFSFLPTPPTQDKNSYGAKSVWAKTTKSGTFTNHSSSSFPSQAGRTGSMKGYFSFGRRLAPQMRGWLFCPGLATIMQSIEQAKASAEQDTEYKEKSQRRQERVTTGNWISSVN